ncbi:MAG: hypothetical protein QW815_01965 [Nitrososphaerota archaeon]
MPRPKIKVEFEDGEGGKYTISIEGSLSKDKVLKIMDLVELLGVKEEEGLELGDSTVAKLRRLIDERFPFGSFTSTQLQEAYEDEYNQPIRLATVSTYLARFADQGILCREKMAGCWYYRKVRVASPKHL